MKVAKIGANVPQDRQPPADLGAGEAAEHQHRNHGWPIGSDLPGQDQRDDQRDQHQIDRKRDDSDPEVNHPPPAFRPETLAGGWTGRSVFRHARLKIASRDQARIMC
jgi:hypothetical protein